MNTRIERYWQEQARKRLLAPLAATFEGDTLKLTKDGKEFTNFSTGATLDWMSGNFAVEGSVVLSWDCGRRKKRRTTDCWHYIGQGICDMVNHH